MDVGYLSIQKSQIKMSMGRNDLCKCGSGFKYKHCCLPMDEASDEEKLTVAKEIYSKHWATSSEHFFEEDYYDWMADQLSPYNPEKIFDLGAGSGNGIVELYNRFNSENLHIISIDENIKCLENASRNIFEKLNIEPFLQARINPVFRGEIHRYQYEPIKYPPDSKIVLLESDFLSEPCLDDVVEISGNLDAVTVWLLGTHEQRHACFHILNQIDSSGEYRLKVQNKAFKFADKILRSGGVLQVVDRGELPEEDFLIEDCIRSYKDQASVTDLEFENLNSIEYQEPDRGIKMELTLGESGRVPENYKLGLTSVIFKKP